MSVATQIERIKNAVANAYTAISGKGGTLPATQNVAGLQTAIASIPSGQEPEPTSYDGDDTNIYIDNTPSWAPLDFTVWFRLQNGTVYVNWGDGTIGQCDKPSTYGTFSLSHTYASRGKYKIAVSRSASTYSYGNVGLGASQVNQIGDLHSLIVYKLEIGTGNRTGSAQFAGLSRCKRILVSSKRSIGSNSWHEFGISAYQLEYLSDNPISGENANNYVPYLPALSTLVIREGSTACGISRYESANSLIDVTIPSSMTMISARMFRYCYSLQKIVIPDSVTSIGYSAFYEARCLTDITIGIGVETIGSEAFYVSNTYGTKKCSSLTCKAVTPPTLSASNVFTNKFATDYTIYVPAGSIAAYEAAANWSAFAGHFQAIPE